MGRSPGLTRRIDFLALSDTDVERLRELRPLLEKHADSLVNSFYRHLLSFGETRSLLADPAVRDRLLGKQREYLLSLAEPTLDDAYENERAAIGETHVRVGLDSSWYLGAYSHYLSLITPLVCEHFRAEPHRGAETIVSINKVLMLDASLAMDAYIRKREAQLDFLNRELASEGRRLAVEVEEQRSELRETTARARAAEHLASIGTLAAGLAHEIGTPMGVIRGHAELLESAVSDGRGRWRLRTIREQIDRISNIMQGLLNMARPHAPVRTGVALGDEIERALSFLSEKLRRRAIVVERHFRAVPAVEGDPERLQQLFLNLILNAADAMAGGGTLAIAIGPSESGDAASVVVSDTGHGIPEEDLQQIFEPFYTTKAAGQGSGLGLMVAKGIVLEHGGLIEARSEPGRGTEFRILFPVVPNQAMEE